MSYFPARRHARVEFQTLPWVFTLRLAESAPADRPLRLEARNMSRGGLKFLSNRKFKLFELLTIHLLEKKGGKALDPLQGKVVRVEEIDTGYGERTFGIALEFADEAATKLLLFWPVGPAKLSPQPFEGK